MKRDVYASSDVPASLFADRDFVLEAVRVQKDVLRRLPEFHADRGVLLAAVRTNPHALHLARVDQLFDRTFVLSAVERNGLALQWAPAELRGINRIAQAAVFSDRHALLFIPRARRAAYRRAGPAETRLLFKHMPFPYDLPEDLVAVHILPRCHRK